MKLLRYGQPGYEKPAVIDNEGVVRSLSPVIPDLTGNRLLPESIEQIRALDFNSLSTVNPDVRIAPCVAGVGKIMCVGLNYTDHAKESRMPVPDEPVLFGKATSAISGPNDPVIIPRHGEKTDWEVELGIVIGKPAKYVSVETALDHVVGYCIINDLSERKFQLEGSGQWIKGKSCDTFAPLGPWLVTTDEIPDPQNLELWLEVDGHRYQQGNTANMIFGVAGLVSYISQFCTLCPGDIISSGTPSGVGLGQKPEPVYLRPGQTMRLGITGLGVQTQVTVAE